MTAPARERSEDLDRYEGYRMPDELRGRTLVTLEPILPYTHDAAACRRPPCVIHSPSIHALTGCLYRLGDDWLIRRVCPHGTVHPDPDSLRYLDPSGDRRIGRHACDGCCGPAPRPRRPRIGHRATVSGV